MWKNVCTVARAMEVRPSVVFLQQFSFFTCQLRKWAKKRQHMNSIKLPQASSCIRWLNGEWWVNHCFENCLCSCHQGNCIPEVPACVVYKPAQTRGSLSVTNWWRLVGGSTASWLVDVLTGHGCWPKEFVLNSVARESFRLYRMWVFQLEQSAPNFWHIPSWRS